MGKEKCRNDDEWSEINCYREGRESNEREITFAADKKPCKVQQRLEIRRQCIVWSAFKFLKPTSPPTTKPRTEKLWVWTSNRASSSTARLAYRAHSMAKVFLRQSPWKWKRVSAKSLSPTPAFAPTSVVSSSSAPFARHLRKYAEAIASLVSTMCNDKKNKVVRRQGSEKRGEDEEKFCKHEAITQLFCRSRSGNASDRFASPFTRPLNLRRLRRQKEEARL